MSSLTSKIITSLRNTLGEAEEFIPLHVPEFGSVELKNVSECITTGWVSSVGKFVDQFEVDLASFCGVERAVAVTNGTSALHICLLLAGVKTGEEVLLPSLTFVATANAVRYCNAAPHFVDVEESTLGIDPEKLKSYLAEIGERRDGSCYNKKSGNRIAALLPMHCFGHPVRLDELAQISEEWGIPLVEDAAESLGSYYKGKHSGSHGILSAVSFNGNKIITTGGGGAILTNDQDLANRAKHITTTAKKTHAWEFDHDEVGYNYRMPNLNAALGVAQLQVLPEFLKKKRRLAASYQASFEGLEGVRFFTEPDGCRSNYWLNTLVLKSDEGLEDILGKTNDVGLMTRPVWKPLHLLAPYRRYSTGNLETTISLSRRLLNIPSTPGLSDIS